MKNPSEVANSPRALPLGIISRLPVTNSPNLAAFSDAVRPLRNGELPVLAILLLCEPCCASFLSDTTDRFLLGGTLLALRVGGATSRSRSRRRGILRLRIGDSGDREVECWRLDPHARRLGATSCPRSGPVIEPLAVAASGDHRGAAAWAFFACADGVS